MNYILMKMKDVGCGIDIGGTNTVLGLVNKIKGKS